MTPNNAIQSPIFQTRTSPSIFSLSQSFIMYTHAAAILGATFHGHSTPVHASLRLPSLTRILSHSGSLPLILHCHWKQSLCVS